MTGIVCINKPEGITSFLAVNKSRRLFTEKKAGHTGTLDPMATGVLPIFFGGATRFIELIPSHDKGYRAKFILGKTTDTLDITGQVLTENEVTASVSDVQNEIKNFVGEVQQLPPMYSAIKKDGVRLYDLARKGIEVEREKRTVTFYSIDMLGYDENTKEFEIDVQCSSGTYIRTLIADIGDNLGCGAVMTSLERTAANGLTLSESYTFTQLEEMAENGTIEQAIIPIEKVINYPKITLSAAQSTRFFNGGEIDIVRIKGKYVDGFYNVYSDQGVFLGVGNLDHEKGNMKAKRVYNDR